MAFEWVMLVRLLHILAAAIWFGSVLFMVLMIGPVVRSSGQVGGQFMGAVMRGGGFGRFFGPAAGSTIVLGIVLYGMMGYTNPMDSTALMVLAFGALFGVLAFIEGLAVTLPTENKLKRLVKEIGPKGPTPEQAATFEKLGAKMSKAGMRGAIMIGLSFVLMLARTLV